VDLLSQKIQPTRHDADSALYRRSRRDFPLEGIVTSLAGALSGVWRSRRVRSGGAPSKVGQTGGAGFAVLRPRPEPYRAERAPGGGLPSARSEASTDGIPTERGPVEPGAHTGHSQSPPLTAALKR